MEIGEPIDTVVEFCNVTGAAVETAHEFLAKHNNNLYEAVTDFFHSQESDSDDIGPAEVEASRVAPQERTYGEQAPPPPPSNMSSNPSSSSNKPKKKFGSLRDFQNEGSNPSPGHGADDDEEKDQEFYTGGDKSGLAVREPGSSSRDAKDHIQRLLDTARRNGPPPPREEDDSGRSNFSGRGQTLGGEDTPSRVVQDPSANSRRPAPMVERTLHLWDDGFSVDDGQLYRYDDPANARTLEMINRGSAPLDIMNVEQGQAVDVKLETHRGENYVQPKQKYKPFSGQGQRLGSPGPGVSPAAAPAPGPAASTATTMSGPGTPSTNADASQPTIPLQIRLADGTRLPARFNTTQTIGDVYDFVTRSSTESQARSFSLATTFPTRQLTDQDQVLGDMAEFKRGGIVVQKWT